MTPPLYDYLHKEPSIIAGADIPPLHRKITQLRRVV